MAMVVVDASCLKQVDS